MRKILLFIVFSISINLYPNSASIVTDPLLSSCLITGITCNGNQDGSITVTATGGQAPYVYSFNGGTYESANTFTDLPPGSYLISTKDALGSTKDNVIIIQEPAILLTATVITPLDCINGATITITATGGTPTYLYSIDDGITFVSNPIFTNIIAGTYSILVKDSYGCVANNFITIKPLTPLITTITKSDISCKGDKGLINVVAIGGQAPYIYSIGNGYQNSNTFTGLSAGSYSVTIKDALGCMFMMMVSISEPTISLTATIETKDENLIIHASGGTGIIKYAISPNLDILTTNNTFTNLPPEIYTLLVQDENGCFLLFKTTINPPAPLVNGKKVIDINFTQGQTLGDLKIDVPNIKWYLKANALTSKTSKIAETELPLTTVLSDNTTYYASQTINGIESTERLAVTTKLATLGTNDFVLTNLNYYPNPVKNVLTLSNTSIIDEITLVTIKGETILANKINTKRTEIDLSNLSEGVYFLKVKSEGTEKTVKFLKE